MREFARGFLTNYPVRQTGTRRQAGRGRQFQRQAHAGRRQRGRSAVSCLWGNPWNKYIWEWNFWGLKSVQLASKKHIFGSKTRTARNRLIWVLATCHSLFLSHRNAYNNKWSRVTPHVAQPNSTVRTSVDRSFVLTYFFPSRTGRKRSNSKQQCLAQPPRLAHTHTPSDDIRVHAVFNNAVFQHGLFDRMNPCWPP